jgi:uracil-DNA glycosylase
MGYDDLVRARKSCRLCVELVNPADTHYDSTEVGPWSRWLASRPAKVVLVGQDWGTVGYFEKYQGRDIPDNLTNRRLIEFLRLLGFAVGSPDKTDRQSGVFATNAILCLKEGCANALAAPVKQKWFSNCQGLLRWTIEEASRPNPPTIITLGRFAYQSVVKAYSPDPPPDPNPAAAEPIRLNGHRLLFRVFHPAARPGNRTFEEMRGDWRRIAEHLKAIGRLQ